MTDQARFAFRNLKKKKKKKRKKRDKHLAPLHLELVLLHIGKLGSDQQILVCVYCLFVCFFLSSVSNGVRDINDPPTRRQD